MTKELPKIYDPGSIEAMADQIWLNGRCFHAEAGDGSPDRAYTIVIPPPNVTAPLHLGHALNNTLQDILIRYHRMKGLNTLWMPGTDHAGIATQTVVEKRLLAEEGKKRTDFQRDEFISRVQAWKDEYEATIIQQLKAMGCSCDWDRTRFTMDDVCAKAVRANFFKLFKDGLIYRGKRLVNWDPATQTVLADDEVEHETVAGHFWYLSYPLVEPVDIDGQKIEHVTVATTRPETMLGDTAVAMNPADPRADALIGKKVRLPIVGRVISIIADDHVVLPDPESEDEKAKFSTGFLKVTPAHDPDDWEIGQRHSLPIINVMAPDGSISDRHGWDDWQDIKNPDVENLIGMDRFEAREAIVEWFRTEKLLEKVREYTHEVGHSYRSHVPVEPYLSDQWYIAVKKPIEHLAEKFGTGLIEGTDVPVNSLAGLALKPLLDGKLRFIPQRYAKTYQNWLENLRDWPISRQLWWGHQIPVWSLYLHNGCGGHVDDNKTRDKIVSSLNEYFNELGLKDNVSIKIETNDVMAWIKICSSTEKADQAIKAMNCYYQISPYDATMFNKYSEVITSQKAWDIARSIMDGPASEQVVQDPDVLDTWFSSALWPFSTMGWPDDTPELKTFYPGDVLCTAREIITLWVSRMVMMGQYCVGDIPFSDVYIHAMIQDGKGRKMSKSLGNGIDPLVAIDSHGADAMRFTLAAMTTDTQDVRMPVVEMQLPDGRKANTSPKFDNGRNFCNKLWNASRFAMMNLQGTDPSAFDKDKMDITDKWILSRLAAAVNNVTQNLDAYKYNEPVNEIYKFFWNDFCDWYLEWIKPRMTDPQQKPIAQNVLAFTLDQVLRILHPFVPFITEGIFQKLNEIAPLRTLNGLVDSKSSEAIIMAQWPQGLDDLINEDVQSRIELIQSVVRPIREIRNKYNIAPTKKLIASANCAKKIAKILNDGTQLISQMASLDSFTAAPDIEKPKTAAAAVAGPVAVYVHDVIDPDAERLRLQKQIQHIESGVKPLEAKLNNESFVTKAKPEVVAQARDKLKELNEQLETVRKHLAELGD
jgi:valyl-tRNA synthetase